MACSNRDRKVLDAIFDPEGSLSSAPLQLTDDGEPSAQDKEAIQLELRAIQAAESGDMQQAFALLDQAIETSPSWPSSYNNRAQLKRMADRPATDAIEDLDTAIRLAASAPLTRRSAKTLAQAHTQRAALLFSLLDPATIASQANLFDLDPTFSPEQRRLHIEERANQDLQQGARYGNAVAKQVAVQTNPYAKLCGRIVREALVSEYSNRDA